MGQQNEPGMTAPTGSGGVVAELRELRDELSHYDDSARGWVPMLDRSAATVEAMAEAATLALRSLEIEKAAKLPTRNAAVRDAAIHDLRAALARFHGGAK